jgi:uncharacterized metal-binding protein
VLLAFSHPSLHQRSFLAFYDLAMIMIFTCDGCSDLGKPRSDVASTTTKA